MEDIVLGLLAILVGLMFCFRGNLAMRLIIPIWGAFAGFALGAGIVESIGHDGFLRSATAWFVGLAFALVFAVFAYLYYAVSVVLAMSAIGFAIGASLMVALDVSWTWVIVLVGVAVGFLLSVLAIVTDMPGMLLIALSAVGGASVATFGVMLMFGATDTLDYSATDAIGQVDNDWWWYALYFGLVIAGIIAQVKGTNRLKATMRENWEAERLGHTAAAR